MPHARPQLMRKEDGHAWPSSSAPATAPEVSLGLARRQLAEAIAVENAALQPYPPDATSPALLQAALHELQVHQIELEMQNEELRRAQTELAASQALYVELYDLAPVGYCTLSEQGVILQINLTLAKLLDQPRGEMVHQPLSRHVLNEDQDIYYLHRKQLLETGQPRDCELRLVKADHSEIWVRLEAGIVPDAGGELISRVVLSDIRGRKQADHTLREWNQMLEHRVAERTLELRQSKARFSQLAQATFEGIAVTSGGLVIDSNDQLCAMYGYKPGEMNGRPVMGFVAPESQAWVRERIFKADERAYECVAIRKDGTRFPAEVHARMGTWRGQQTRISALRDLSETKRVAAKLQSQQTELEHAQRLALVSEVSTGIIHQIGQPLCAMGANLSVAIGKINGCKSLACGTHEIFQDLQFNMDCLREAVVHLRALAHPEQPRRVLISVNDLAEGALRLLRQESERRQIALTVECDHGLPPVLADAVQLSQVILNLVHNAFDACAGGPPERRTVVISTRVLGYDRVELSVRDRGHGITPAVLNRLFAPFFTTKAEGIGIGLRLSQTIVEAHGGSIKGCNNADGIGAVFRVVLPGRPAGKPDVALSP